MGILNGDKYIHDRETVLTKILAVTAHRAHKPLNNRFTSTRINPALLASYVYAPGNSPT